jgi:hypothetical protein
MDEERLAVAGLGPTYPRWGYEPAALLLAILPPGKGS